MQINSGAVDAVTGAATYTLNSDYLLRQRVDGFARLTLRIKIQHAGHHLQALDVMVNTCDTVTQVNQSRRKKGESRRRNEKTPEGWRSYLKDYGEF